MRHGAQIGTLFPMNGLKGDFQTPAETVARGPSQIYLDTYMLCGVYEEHGICI
jgi:hypothetical protein